MEHGSRVSRRRRDGPADVAQTARRGPQPDDLRHQRNGDAATAGEASATRSLAARPGGPLRDRVRFAADACRVSRGGIRRRRPDPRRRNEAAGQYLRGLAIERVNQVWCSDITYIPMAKGFLYLVVIMDWVSRAVLAWRLSNTLDADFCVEALEEALSRYGRPEIFNTDQGSQFTSDDFTGTLKRHGVTISMDGKGRFMDNIFVERLWRSLKYEEVYLHAYATVAEAKAGIGSWLDFYNTERQHQSLGYRTPRQIYQEGLWVCGRSALPTGCASPTSRASSEGGEMLTFAHIPTGTTVDKAIDIDDSKSRGVAPITAPTMIGADFETGGATP